MKKIFLIFIFVISISIVAISSPFEYEICNLGWKHVHHDHNEESYQEAWCRMHGGVMEYENDDYTRVDCLTKTHAVEFDFANKWHESIGQALHYGVMTNRIPKVVLILDKPVEQMVYYKRVKKIADKYGFEVEYVTNDILRLDSNNKCFNKNCKCHRKNDI